MTNEEMATKIYELLECGVLQIAIECAWCGEKEISHIDDIDINEEQVCTKCWVRANT